MRYSESFLNEQTIVSYIGVTIKLEARCKTTIYFSSAKENLNWKKKCKDEMSVE